jgi:hypothetical protein
MPLHEAPTVCLPIGEVDGAAGSILGEPGAPVLDALTQCSHVLWVDAVLGEILVIDAVDAAEHRREELPVEAGVGLVGQLA